MHVAAIQLRHGSAKCSKVPVITACGSLTSIYGWIKVVTGNWPVA